MIEIVLTIALCIIIFTVLALVLVAAMAVLLGAVDGVRRTIKAARRDRDTRDVDLP